MPYSELTILQHHVFLVNHKILRCEEEDTHWGCCCGGRCSGCAAGRGPECAGNHVDSAERVPSERLEQAEQTSQ